MQVVLRFADGDVEHHELADSDVQAQRFRIERNGRHVYFIQQRWTFDGRPVFVEDPTAAIFKT